MNIPYSYSKMMKFLGDCVENSVSNNIEISVNSIAKTVCGNDVP